MSAPYGQVVVGTDGSDTAEHAVESAALVARELGAPLTVATAWYRDMPDAPVLSRAVAYPSGDPGAMEASWADLTVSDGAAIARSRDVTEVRTVTPQGHAADALLDEAEHHDDPLLVVGTAGLGSRAERLLGNVPHEITHHAGSDVLLVRSDATMRSPYARAGLATDGSETAATAVKRGLDLARAVGAREIVLLTVARSQQDGEEVLAAVAAGLHDGDLDRRVLVGRPVADVLSDAAAELDLLVIGNKGMSGPSRLLGSVANGVTHAVPTDLLLVNTVRRTVR